MEEYSLSKQFLNMILNLGLLLALIFAATWYIKRMMRSKLRSVNNASQIKIIEKRSLTPKSHIYLIEVAGKTLVIGESAAGLHTLTTYQTEVEEPIIEELEKPVLSFADVLKRKLFPLKRS